MTTTDTLRALTAFFRSGRVLHARDTGDCPITAGPVAVPGETEPRWVVYRYPPPGYGAGGLPCEEDDCGSAAAVARVLVRRHIGAAVAGRALEAAGG